ncbi:MAG: PAS domain S-box protein [Desulfarculus sp.]|nr:PAS domain S-box protein [Desulfarculus sp.]
MRREGSTSGGPFQEELELLRRELAQAREAAARQRQTQEALRDSEARYRLLFESSPDAVVLYDSQGRVLYVNQAFVDTYGWSRQEWLGKRVDFVPPPEREKTAQVIADTLAGRKSEFETRRLTKDGRLLDVLLTVAPFNDPRGEITGIYVIHRDITAKKRAEAALAESEARYRQLLDASPNPIAVYDPEGRVNYLNPAFEQLYGWSLEELRGQRIENFVPPDQAAKTAEAWRRTLAGEKVSAETRRLTKDGRTLEVLLQTSIVQGGDGQLLASIVTHQDQTEHKRAEAALVESRRRYRQLLDASPDPITVYDHQGKVTYINPAFQQTFGWSLEELAGRGIDFVPPHEQERTRDAVLRTLAGENVLLESQRLTKDGRLLDIQLKTAIFSGPDGQVAGDIVIYRDISQRKKAEEELKRHRDHLEELVAEGTQELRQANQKLLQEIAEHRRTSQALRAAEASYRLLYEESRRVGALYRSLFNSSADAIIVYDLEGRVQFLNQAFTQVFGWTQEELAGRPLDFVPQAEAETTHQRVREVVDLGLAQRGVQTRRHTKDGRLLEVEISASRFEDHLDRPAGMVVIIRDTTERVRAQQEKERLEGQLSQALKMEAVGVLASGIAHDFNNILQVVSGYLQLMMAKERGLDHFLPQLRQMDRLVNRGAELVRGLLTFGRKVRPRLAPLSLNQVIGQIVAVLRRTIPPMISIETRLAPELWEIAGDANQLEHLLVNLAGNARDAMPQGGRLLIETANQSWDELSARNHPEMTPGDYVLFRVSDSGQGMDQNVLPHIFEPFFTTKEVGQGTGLGLSTVYGIVKGHGGYISCYSSPGQGTSFSIYLPVPAAQRVLAGDAPPAPQAAPVGQETILLVDDEPAIVEVAREMLERHGYRVLEAVSGEQALGVYAQGGPGVDLVILDLGMPGMGGQRALEEIMALNPQAKVIVASGYTDNPQIERCRASGAAEFIAKPYRLLDMLQRVRQVLDRPA